MKPRFMLLSSTLLLGLVPQESHAQLNNVPIVLNRALDYQPWEVSAFYGRGDGGSLGNASLGARVGVSPTAWLNIDLGGGTLNPMTGSGDRTTTVQGMASLAVGPTFGPDNGTQFSIYGFFGIGAADLGADSSSLDMPIGLGLVWAPLWFELWAVPQYAMRKLKHGDESAWQRAPGIAFGTELIPEIFTFFRIQAAVQWQGRDEVAVGDITHDGETEFSWMLGLKTRFPINPD